MARSHAHNACSPLQFLSSGIGGIGTTAGPEIQRVWAGVENLQNQLFGAAGNLLFILGLWLVRERTRVGSRTLPPVVEPPARPPES